MVPARPGPRQSTCRRGGRAGRPGCGAAL